MKLFPALLLGLAQFGDAHPHHQHRRHMQEQASPVVQELQKELVYSAMVAREQCQGEAIALCDAHPDEPSFAFSIIFGTDSSPEPISSSEEEEIAPRPFVFFNQGKRRARHLAHAAKRKLFVWLDDEDQPENEHSHEHSHDGMITHTHPHGHDHHDHEHDEYDAVGPHKHGKPCHRHGPQVQEAKYGFGQDADKCIKDLVVSDSPDLSVECKTAITNVEIINEELNNEIMMEQAAEEFAALFFFCFTFLLTLTLLRCVFRKHGEKFRAKRMLRRGIIQAVYEDEDLKAAVEAKTGLVLGDVAPIRPDRKASPPEKCGCGCFVRTICRGLLFAVMTIFLLHIFFFFPIMLPITLLVVGARACCGKKRGGDDELVAQEGYPAAAGVTTKGASVYVGVPTTVV